MWKWFLLLVPRLWANWITLLGSVLASVSAVGMAVLGFVLLSSPEFRPYTTALTLLVGPVVFCFGVAVIVAGLLWERLRRRTVEGPILDPLGECFKAAFADKRIRRLTGFVAFATVFNIVVITVTSTAAVHYMDTPGFCGKLCHSVMQPEYDTYRESPHSRVACVTCHIGPGASWAVKSKIDGLRQVWGILTDDFSRPIPSPVKELRPARDTCEQCHWPAKFHGNRVALRTHYQDDETNSATLNALLLKVGGRNPETGDFHGIHWHVSPDVEIRFEPLDARREKVGRVQVYKGGTLSAEYLPKEGGPQPTEPIRAMDCVDCHNRPTHVYDPNPAIAVDRAFNEGALDKAVPFLHEVSVKALTEAAAQSVERETVAPWLKVRMGALYKELHPDASVSDVALQKAAEGVSTLYLRNVYPHLKLTFGAHFNHLGHLGDERDRRGCFRCHDDEHAAKDGKTISMDCELCHGILAMDEDPATVADPLKALLP